MSEFKGLDKMVRYAEGIANGVAPNWTEEWGDEVSIQHAILNMVFHSSREMPMEERNALLKVIKEEFIPLNNRWRQALQDESEEARQLYKKYNNEEIGVFHQIRRELEAFRAGLPARYPFLVPIVERNIEWYPLMMFGPGKGICSASDDEPTILYTFGNPIHTDGLLTKSYQIMSRRLFKKATLQEQQIEALLRALKEAGAQNPAEFAAIQQQVDDLKQPGPEEPAQPEAAGAREDPCPDANPFALIEHSGGSEFTAVYTNQAKPMVLPPHPWQIKGEFKVTELEREELQAIFHTLAECKFARIFLEPPLKRYAPRYFDIVKEHHDIVTISAKVENPPANWWPHGPFHELRLMIDNYCHVFGEGTSQYRRALQLEEKFLEELKKHGEAGEKAKVCELPVSGPCNVDDTTRTFANMPLQKYFDEAPRAEFNDTDELPDDTMFTIDTQAALEDIEAFNQEQEAGGKKQETGEKSREQDGEGRVEDDQYEDADDESQETDDENENVIDPDEQETSFAQGINNEWDSDYGDAREHSLEIEDDFFERQDGDDHEGSPVNPSPNPRDPSSPSSGEGDTIARAWNVMDKALQYDKKVGNPTRAPVRPHNAQQPGASSSAQPPRPPLDDDEPGEQPAAEVSFFDRYDYPNPDATSFGPPTGAATDEASLDNALDRIPKPSSGDLPASSQAAAGEVSPDNTLGSIWNPYSDDDLVSYPSDAASEAEKEGTHASAHAFQQPDPIAPMVAQPLTIQLPSLPQAQTAHAGSASQKRARESDDQDSSDDDVPLIKMRKLAGKAPAPAAAQEQAPASSAAAKGKAPASVSASSSHKRRRDDSDADSDGDDVHEQPSKRQRKTPGEDNTPSAAAKGKAVATSSQHNTPTAAPKDNGKAPAAPVASSSRKRSRDEAEDDGDNYAPEQSLKKQRTSPASAQTPVSALPAQPAAAGPSEPFDVEVYNALKGRNAVAREAQRQQQLQDRWAHLPPSPAVEPLTPERPRRMSPERAEPAVAGPSQQAAADEPPREPATTSLGHTEQGTITVMQLSKLPKYKKTAKTKGAIANRPWVFGYSLGGQYALYVMRCPTKGCPKAGCETGPEVFRKNPLYDNDPACHLHECCGDFDGGDHDTMVRNYCKQGK